MAKKKSKIDISKFNVDFTSQYLIPMLPKGTKNYKKENATVVVCNIELLSDGYTIRARCENYQDAYFYIEFFDWMIYTKKFEKYIDN